MSGKDFARFRRRLDEMTGTAGVTSRQAFLGFLAEVEACRQETLGEAHVGQMLALMAAPEGSGRTTCGSAAGFIALHYEKCCNAIWGMMSWLATELPDAETALAQRMGREALRRGDADTALGWLLETLRRYPFDASLQQALAELPDQKARDFLSLDAPGEPLRGGTGKARSVRVDPDSGHALTLSATGELGRFIPQTGTSEPLGRVGPGPFFFKAQGGAVVCSPAEGRMLSLSPDGGLSACGSLPPSLAVDVSDCVRFGGREYVLGVRAGTPAVFRLDEDRAVGLGIAGLESPCAMTVLDGRLVLADAYSPHLFIHDPETGATEVLKGVWPHGQALALRADPQGIHLLTQEHLVRVRPGSGEPAFATSVLALCRARGNGSALDAGQWGGGWRLVVAVTATPGLCVMSLDRA